MIMDEMGKAREGGLEGYYYYWRELIGSTGTYRQYCLQMLIWFSVKWHRLKVKLKEDDVAA